MPLRGSPAPTVRARRPPAVVAAALGVVAGALFAGQTRVNGQLGERLGSAVLAALVSFLIGCVAAAAVVAALPRARRAVAVTVSAPLPWWSYLGGLGGAVAVTVAATAAPVVGVAMFSVAFVAGQAAGGLALDRTALAPAGRRPLSARRVTGALLAVAAVVVLIVDRPAGAAASSLVVLLAALVAGVLASVQQALNGGVQRATGQPMVAALANFLVGAAALAAAVLVVRLASGGPSGALPADPWLYAGGLIGVSVIALSAWAVVRLGVLRVGLASLAGQLAGGLAIDATWSQAGGGAVRPATVVAVVLAFLGVALSRDRLEPAGRPSAGSGSVGGPAGGAVAP